MRIAKERKKKDKDLQLDNLVKYPILVINAKTYNESNIKKVVKIAKICEVIEKKYMKDIIFCPQVTELGLVCHASNVKVFSQHIDAVQPGAHTGFVLAESVKELGAIGTILNHSEHKLNFETLKKSILRAKKAGLLSLVCASTPREAMKIASLKPDMIAIEPPELIGGDVSVSTAKPEVITDTVAKVNKVANIPVLCGAGIKSKEDVKIAISLGAKGVLVASGVIKSQNPRKSISELVSGL